MEGRELAVFKNDVLYFLNTFGSETVGVDFIFNKMKHPLNNERQLLDILVQMTKEEPENLDFDPDGNPPDWFSANDNTIIFLNKGGFLIRYEKHQKTAKTIINKDRQDQRIKDLEERNLKAFPWPIIISGISAAIALGSLYINSNSVSRSELKTIQKSIDSLRSDFIKENYELKEKLFKAEMWISVLEEDSIK